MEDIILPIFMCVVMPVAIVWLVMRAKQNETNKMAEIMLKAIEAGIPLDPDFFKTQTWTLQKSLKETASILGIPSGTVKYHLSMGRAHLKKLISL